MHMGHRILLRLSYSVKDLKIHRHTRTKEELSRQPTSSRDRKDPHSKLLLSQLQEAAWATNSSSRSTRYSNSKFNKFRVLVDRRRKVKSWRVLGRHRVFKCNWKGARIALLSQHVRRIRNSRSSMKMILMSSCPEKFQLQYQDSSKVESTATVSVATSQPNLLQNPSTPSTTLEVHLAHNR